MSAASPATGSTTKQPKGNAPPVKRVIGPLLGIARIRCKDPLCKHGEATGPDGKKSSDPVWFKHMYLLIANAVENGSAETGQGNEAIETGDDGAINSDENEKQKDDTPVFTVWLTDEKGYITPLKTQEEKDKEAEKKRRIQAAAKEQVERRKKQVAERKKEELEYNKKLAEYKKADKDWLKKEADFKKKHADWEKKKKEKEAKGLPPPPEPPPLPGRPTQPESLPPPEEPIVVIPDLSGLETPFDTIRLAPQENYLLHFVLSAEEATARDYLKQANTGNLKDEDGNPRSPMALQLTTQVTGKRWEKGQKTASDVEESVFVVDKTPDFLSVEGSDLYEGMVLFYTEIVREEKTKKGKIKRTFLHVGMPNGECPRVKTQVEKLQAHLGAFRFPLGHNGLPYFGSVLVPDACPFENRGVFDALTYGALVAFQKCVMKGDYVKIDDALYREIIDFDNNYSVKPACRDLAFARKRSNEFLKGDPASEALPVGELGVADKLTADAIQKWLDEGRRKPDPILVAINPTGGGAETGEWMRNDAVTHYRDWKQAVKELGWHLTMTAGHVFRDIRTAVVEAPVGMATKSIHKCGMAADMAMSNYGPDHREFDVDFQWDVSVKGKPKSVPSDPLLDTEPDVRWRVFGEIKKEVWESGKERLLLKARELGLPATIFRDEIRPWRYNPKDMEGGKADPLKKGIFLDLTAVGAAFGFEPISTAGQWAFRFVSVADLNTSKGLWAAIDYVATAGGDTNLVVRRPAVGTTEMAFVSEIDIESLRRWVERLSTFDFFGEPLPDVSVPSVDDQARGNLENLIQTEFADARFILSGVGVGGGAAFERRLLGRDVHLQQSFLETTIRPDSGPYSMRKGDSLFAGMEGVKRSQEWWHFQYQPLIDPHSGRRLWVDLLEELGYSREGLLKLGYPREDMIAKAY